MKRKKSLDDDTNPKKERSSLLPVVGLEEACLKRAGGKGEQILLTRIRAYFRLGEGREKK